MKPASPGVKLTYDDFLLFPDDGKRHELIDGEHYVTRHRTRDISESRAICTGSFVPISNSIPSGSCSTRRTMSSSPTSIS
jgi:hypothetical protein